MNIEKIGVFHSPLAEKFGIPRQAGLAGSLEGWIELLGDYARPEAVDGLDGFDYLWIIWGFSLNRTAPDKLKVRPPRLGGNERVGVFASRSPFRPNPLGLSSVKILSVEPGKIRVAGADIADGTPVYDIKPYVTYADSHPEARSGFVDENEFHRLEVLIPEKFKSMNLNFPALEELLSIDPRPAYQDSDEKNYGLLFEGHNVRFTVSGNKLSVTDLE